jgi:hypothetical protein
MIAASLSVVVLAAGYQAYIGFTRVDDIESRREQMTLNVQNLMARMKSDIRSGASVSGSARRLVITGTEKTIIYTSLPGGAGVERVSGSRRTRYKEISAEFSTAGRSGANVRLTAQDSVHRRPIRIEVSSFIRPRNR